MKILFIIFLLLISVVVAEDKIDNDVIDRIGNDDVEVVVVLKETNGFGIMAVDDSLEDIEKNELESINGFTAEIDIDDLNDLMNSDKVEKVYYKDKFKILLQDSVPLINASYVHSLNYGNGNITGKGQTICVVDTGINYTHSDLGGCSGDEFLNGTCSKVIAGFDYVNNDPDPMDDQGHGTHVAGIAAANGSLVGVAPDAQLLAVKVCNSAANSACNYVQEGLDWCVSNSDTYNITIISMSIGSTILYSSACDEGNSLSPFVDAAFAKNIPVVVASGNSGSSTAISSPACMTNVTAVGRSGDSDEVYTGGDRNALVDLMAPGSSITSTSYLGGYEPKGGTSMSTPHVAGAMALLNQYYEDTNQTLGILSIVQQLQETGKKIIDSVSGLVFSRIDVYSAINDTHVPEVVISFSNDVLELGQNLTISIDYTDALLDFTYSNVSLPNGTLLAENTLEFTNLTSLGTYNVVAFANDTNFNENLTSKTFLVRDTSGLGVSSFIFNTVEDNNFSNGDVDFNISIGSKYNLTNVTLSHNFTSWHENSTISLSLNETEVNFSNSFLEGIYLWNVEACDLNNYCVNSGNKTLYVDLSAPVVSLISPINASIINVRNVDFIFNVSDYNVSSCDLFFNNATNESLSSVNLSSNNQFNLDLQDGNYNWSVNCTDSINRESNSLEWTFDVSCSESWSCTDYSGCSGGTQTRTCTDANSCGTVVDKPGESTSCSSGGSSGGGSTSNSNSNNANTQTQSSFRFGIDKGDTKRLTISKDVGISGLEFKFKNDVNAQITVSKQDSKPSSVSAVSNVYEYIKISTNLVEEDLEEAKIEFKVEQSWININALGNGDNVYLNRYKDGRWVKLETVTAGVDGIYQKYVAITPGFSYFAVSADKTVPVVKTILEEEENETIEEQPSLEKNVEEEKEIIVEESILKKFTGKVTEVVSKVYSPYSLIGLGALVVILVGFLVLRFNGRISRGSGSKMGKILTIFGLLRIFKRSNGKTIGKWDDGKDTEEAGFKFVNKKGYFKKFFSKKKGDDKMKEKETKEEKPGFFKRLFSRKKEEMEIKPKDIEQERPEQKRVILDKEEEKKKLSEKKQPSLKKNVDKEKEKKPGFFSKLFKKKDKHDFEVKVK